ncbi:MAG: hypothetical protein RLW62_21855, partial [Gammaproteobacteria bacterium]
MKRSGDAYAAPVVLLVTLLGACHATPPASVVTPAPAASVTTPAAGAQTVHFSARLRALMQRMNAMLYERNQTELEIDKERLARARELADAAATLAREASLNGPPGIADPGAREDFA